MKNEDTKAQQAALAPTGRMIEDRHSEYCECCGKQSCIGGQNCPNYKLASSLPVSRKYG